MSPKNSGRQQPCPRRTSSCAPERLPLLFREVDLPLTANDANVVDDDSACSIGFQQLGEVDARGSILAVGVCRSLGTGGCEGLHSHLQFFSDANGVLFDVREQAFGMLACFELVMINTIKIRGPTMLRRGSRTACKCKEKNDTRAQRWQQQKSLKNGKGLSGSTRLFIPSSAWLTSLIHSTGRIGLQVQSASPQNTSRDA